MTRTYAIIIAIVISLIAVGAYTVFFYHAGGKGEIATQAVAQVKHDKKVKKDYDKIDRQTPYGGAAADVAAFLLGHVRADNK